MVSAQLSDTGHLSDLILKQLYLFKVKFQNLSLLLKDSYLINHITNFTKRFVAFIRTVTLNNVGKGCCLLC